MKIDASAPEKLLKNVAKIAKKPPTPTQPNITNLASVRFTFERNAENMPLEEYIEAMIYLSRLGI